MATIAQRFVETASLHPTRRLAVAAYRPTLDELSYGEALRRARVFAQHLRAAGTAAGDRVLLHAPNSLEYVCAYFGIWLAGGTVVPVDPRSRPGHVERVYRDCAARAVVVATRRPDLDSALHQIGLADLDWSSGNPGDQSAPSAADPALIIYTSGTTGVPRGVCLSNANLDHTRASITTWANVTDHDRELTTLSLTHLFGLAHLHVYCALGGTLYLEEGFRDVPRLIDLIDRAGITSFPATPAGLKVILDHFSDLFAAKARRLRYIVINTAPMPVPYIEKLLAALPETEIYMYYGLTEASRSTYIAYRHHRDKLATVGRPTPGADVCIGSPTRKLVDEPGEILVTGPHVTSTYWNHDSTDLFDQGWFKTGDLGTIDGQGFLTWRGRIKDQINVNGLKLVPSEVEDVLRQDQRVKDCAVVGAPEPATGESVVAFVVTEAGNDNSKFELHLRRLCNQYLEDYKVPRRILFVDEIPKTDSGKVKRFLLRDRLSAGA
jgi:long-chain acyl-CoA synthetase